MQICDWFPTFLELLEVPPADERAWAHMQGVSLLPTWQGRPVRLAGGGRVHEAAADHRARPAPRSGLRLPQHGRRRWKAIRVGDDKYHWASDGHDLLFDLRSDPGERNNLIDTHPEKAMEMRRMLENFLLPLARVDYGDEMRNHGFRNIRWESVDRLRAWGVYRDVTPEPRRPQ